VAGPIAFVGVSSSSSGSGADLKPVGGRYRSLKMLAVVDPAAEATVSVSPAGRAHASLIYDPSAFRDDGLYALSDGTPAVRFRACAKGEGQRSGTQFNGGLIVDGPRCVTLDVVWPGASPVTVIVSAGNGQCATA
jgi:hypothetical protein